MPPIVRFASARLLGVSVTGVMTVINACGYVNQQINEVIYELTLTHRQ